MRDVAGGEGMRGRRVDGEDERKSGPSQILINVFFYFRKGSLVFSSGPLAKMDPFYCSVAKMRPFIVWRPN